MKVNNNLKDSKRSKIRLIKKQEAEKLYEDDAYIIIHPKTMAASCLYGKGTKWCTAAKEDNRFDTFNSQGKLYIVIDKIDNHKYQFHFESQSYKDEENILLTEESSIFKYFSPELKFFFKSMANHFSLEGIVSYKKMKSFYYLWAYYSEVEEFYERCIELDPDNAIDYILDMEKYYFTYGKFQEAIDWLSRFLNSEISGIEMIYQNLGQNYLALGQDLRVTKCFNKAIKRYKEELVLTSDSEEKIHCLERIGCALFYQKKYSEALTYYLQIEELYPGNESYYNTAICYEALEDYEKALFYYQRSIGQSEDIVTEDDIIGKIEEISKKVVVDYPF